MRGVIVPPSKLIVFSPPRGGFLYGGFIIKGGRLCALRGTARYVRGRPAPSSSPSAPGDLGMGAPPPIHLHPERQQACMRGLLPVCVCVCVCACAWAPANGMTHLDWAVLYLGMRACYIRLRSGWGSDGNVYNALRGLNDFWKPSGA